MVALCATLAAEGLALSYQAAWEGSLALLHQLRHVAAIRAGMTCWFVHPDEPDTEATLTALERLRNEWVGMMDSLDDGSG
jgi:hypothetical protein